MPGMRRTSCGMAQANTAPAIQEIASATATAGTPVTVCRTAIRPGYPGRNAGEPGVSAAVENV